MDSKSGWTLQGRFLCKECLKAHNQVESWLAEDIQTGESVFVKIALPSQVGLSNRLRISHESQLLRELQTSSLAKLLHFGETDELVYLVTEYIPGHDLRQILAQGPLDQNATTAIAVRLLQALSEVHQQNILHRDIKPSNIKVPSPNSATLVDFGLSKARDAQPREFGAVTGSLLYMAPEQLGLLAREISPATDLYSLGVVLYECLAGRPPFWSESLSELLRKHLTQAPPQLSQFRPDISERLEFLIRRLLKKEPQDRFLSAELALTEFEAFRDRLKEEYKVEVAPALPGLRQIHAPFVGRRGQKKQLTNALEQTSQGRAQSIIISGEAGSGKSRLLDDLVLQAVKQSFAVYRGRAEAEESSGPFALLEGIADKIALELSQNPHRNRALKESLGEQASILAATFPSLGSLCDLETKQEATPWLDAKVLRALRSLFREISSPDCPALIILDDIHWSDAATRRFILLWNAERSQVKENYSLLVLGTRPSDEVADVRASCSVDIELPPFSPSEVDELFSSLDLVLSVSELSLMMKLTAGNPLLVVETLREVSSDCPDAELSLDKKLASLDQQGLFANRISRVSAATRRFLQLAAQLGQSFQPLGLGFAADFDNTEVFESLSEAKAESLVWEDAATGKYYFLHDRIRQHLSKALNDREKVDLHLDYARYLSQEMPDSHYELAFHYDLAGESKKAAVHAVSAARMASRRNALDTAIFYYRIARKVSPYQTDSELAEELADCCMLVGDYSSALDLYKGSHKLATDTLSQARLLGKLGELHQKMGSVGEASKAILAAIKLLGSGVPASALGRRLETGWRIGMELLSPSENTTVSKKTKSPKSLLLAHLYSRLSYVWFWTHGQADLLFIHLRHLQEASHHPQSRELAQAYASHAIACIGAYQFDRARRFANLSLDLRREIGDSWGEAHAYNTLGIVLYASTKVDECIEVVKQAETLLDAAGDLWELAVCRYNLALCYYRKGQLSQAREPAKRAYSVGLECGDVQASGVSLGVLVRCSPLEITEEQLQRELQSRDLDSATQAWLLEARGIRWLALGQPAKAIQDLEESWAISTRLGRKTEYVASSPCWLATAYREQLEKLPPFAVKERLKLMQRLRRIVKTSLSWAQKFQNNLPHALREQAYLYALQGLTQDSLHSLRRSLDVAEKLGFQQEVVLTAKAQLRLKEALNISLEEIGRSTKATLDYSKLLDYQAHESISQIERFQQVLGVAANLTKADDFESIVEVMRQSAVALFRTEDSLVLELQDNELVLVSGDDSGKAVSQTLARHALSRGTPSASVDDLPLSESLVMAEIRSALCIPFGSEASRFCCVQITHQSAGHIFAEEENRIASYLSSLGTAALDSAASREAVREAERLEEQRKKQLELMDARRDGLIQSLGIASHDLKNLIFIVQSVSRGLPRAKGQEDLERAQGYLELICRKASWMVNIYLDVTQAHNTGSIPCEISTFDLAELGEDVTSFLNESLALESQKPRIDFRGESVMVRGDKDRLWQAVANIVGNALNHTPLDSPIEVEVAAMGTGGYLAVGDKGPGIEPEIQQSLFDPFVQARRDSKGSGLGLWIAKLVVESSGGFLDVSSEVGKGTTFTISLGTQHPTNDTNS